MPYVERWCPMSRYYDPLKAGSIDGTDTEPHDHGIVRAMQAYYRPNKLVVGDPKLTIFVGRLNPETTEETIKEVFSHYGEIVNCRLIRDIITGFSKCYAFVEFEDKHGALKAHREAHKTTLDGNEIFVDFECERTLSGWIPRRLGGGFSGKKESGQLRFGGRDRPFKKPIFINKNSQSKTFNKDAASEDGHFDRNRRSEKHIPRDQDRWRDRSRDRNRERDKYHHRTRKHYDSRSRDRYHDRYDR